MSSQLAGDFSTFLHAETAHGARAGPLDGCASGSNRLRTREESSIAALEVIRSGGRSVVRRAFAESPLRLLTPRNHGAAAWVYTGTYGGGLVDGDALQLSVSVGPDAMTFLSTQASTKIFRSPRGTRVELDAAVAAGALLVSLPDPVIGFAGSSYRQVQRFELDREANLVLLDWFSSGRRASGERWQFARYDSHLVIRHSGRLVLLDSLLLSGDEGRLVTRMGRFNVVALISIVGPIVRQYADSVMSVITQMPVRRRADSLVAASAMANLGCIVRIAGVSLEDVARMARDFLRFVPEVLGDDPWARKW